MALKEGDRAPNFTTVDHTGKRVTLDDLRGKVVWLWFYSSSGGGN
jgi:peroxiredoxin